MADDKREVRRHVPKLELGAERIRADREAIVIDPHRGCGVRSRDDIRRAIRADDGSHVRAASRSVRQHELSGADGVIDEVILPVDDREIPVARRQCAALGEHDLLGANSGKGAGEVEHGVIRQRQPAARVQIDVAAQRVEIEDHLHRIGRHGEEVMAVGNAGVEGRIFDGIKHRHSIRQREDARRRQRPDDELSRANRVGDGVFLTIDHGHKPVARLQRSGRERRRQPVGDDAIGDEDHGFGEQSEIGAGVDKVRRRGQGLAADEQIGIG